MVHEATTNSGKVLMTRYQGMADDGSPSLHGVGGLGGSFKVIMKIWFCYNRRDFRAECFGGVFFGTPVFFVLQFRLKR